MIETSGRRRFGEGREPIQRANPGRGLVTVLNVVVASHFRATAFLIACCALLFLPGFFNIPPIDREEALSAQATRQMVETGDFIDIRNQEEVRSNKPVAIHWLQAAAITTANAFGLPRADVRIWLYRVPSLIGAAGAVLLTYWAALAFVTRRGAILAALMMCTSVLLGLLARLANAETMLLLTTTAALGAMARVYLPWQRGEERPGPSWSTAAIFWTAIAGGILLKGPLIVLFVALPVATLTILDRSAGWLPRLRPVVGVIWAMALISPWLAAMALRGDALFDQFDFADDALGWMMRVVDLRGGPPGMQFAMFWLMFWPGAALTALAVPAVWRARREPAAQFLLAWVVPAWIVMEIAFAKTPNNVLPLYPAIAILISGTLKQRVLSRRPWLVRGLSWWFVLPALVAVLAIAGVIALTRQPAFLAWPFAAIAAILGLFAWWLYDDNRGERSLLNAFAAASFVSLTIYGIILPSLTPLFPSAEIARALRGVVCRQPRAASAGYSEPSLVFMTGTSTVLTDASGAADFLSQGSCRFALVDSRQERSFAQRADAIGLRYAVLTRVEGYNYTTSRSISVSVFRSEDTQ